MASGFLLDNNHVQAWFQKNPNLLRVVEALPPETIICTCAIIFGEIHAGHAKTQTTNQARRDEYAAWVNEKFMAMCLPITVDTREAFATIIGRLWKKYPPTGRDTKDERHLILVCGVDMNDVWAAAVAYQHNLALVTSDKMEKIREVMPELEVQCWTS